MKKLIVCICLCLSLLLSLSLSACNGNGTNGGSTDGGSTDGGGNTDSGNSGSESGGDDESGSSDADDNDPIKDETEMKLTLNELSSPVAVMKPIVSSYLTAARASYASPAYADYATSIISEYKTASADRNDAPLPVTLSFSEVEGAVSYMLELSLSSDFTANTRRFFLGKETSLSVANLYTGATYYWRVCAFLGEEKTVTSEISTFETEKDAVRWIAVDGVRNVRDLGGWTGLKQGMVYRGSELNAVGNHGLAITDAGRTVLREELGIQTDLDFRAVSDNGASTSPIGGDVAWVNRPIGNFLSAFTDEYRLALKEFAKAENYPIYMHCWGGADRTGTVALILEGLCGVKEEDLAIDLELTSFSAFGYRYRYDNGDFLYASTLAKIKNDYEGTSLQEKFEGYALALGLTRAEISNIQSLLGGTGVVFANNSLQNIILDPESDQDATLFLEAPRGVSVTAVRFEGAPLPYRFENGVLTLSRDALLACGKAHGTLVITASDGQTLSTDISLEKAPTLAEKIAGGDLKPLFNDGGAIYGNGTVKKASGSLTLTHDALRALADEGYTAISFRASADLTGTVSATDKRIRLLARWKNGASYLAADKQDLTADTFPTCVESTLTVRLTEELLGESNVFTLVPQSGKNVLLSDFALIR